MKKFYMVRLGNSAFSGIVSLIVAFLITLLTYSPSFAETAAYSGSYGAPLCSTGTGPCNATSAVIGGRDNMQNGNEPTQPNTVDTCQDGTSGQYMLDENVESVTIEDMNGGDFCPGDMLSITSEVWCYSATTDFMDLSYSSYA